jgi:hypothetical protein
MSELSSAPTAPAPRDRAVITFYSYKGGVGRSMAVANIAWLLASKYGKSVIVVDWDLEAPGLHRFFGIDDRELGPGLIDYVTSYRDALKEPHREFSADKVLIDDYLRRVDTFATGGSLHLMSAGSLADRASYTRKVREFDWKAFYDNWGGAQFIEAMRTQFRQKAEITLIDSRTGVTDIGGICTVQLPDTVVFVFVFNWQNLGGIETIASELHDRDNTTLQALNRRPALHFLPSRKEPGEQKLLRSWEKKAEERFAPFCDSAPLRAKYGTRIIDYIRDLSIPYVSYFAYGEELAAKTELGLEICRPLEQLIDLLLQEGAADAAAAASTRAGETRRFLGRRLETIGAAAFVPVLAAFIYSGYGFWQGRSVAELLAPIVGSTPMAQWVATLLVGALCGAGGALGALSASSSQDDAPIIEPRRFWSRAAAFSLSGAALGLALAALAQTSRFLPLISFVSGFALVMVLDAISRLRRPGRV